SLGLTLLLLVLAWAGLQALAAWLVDVASYPWLDTAVAILTGIGILVGLAFLIAPVTTLFAGIFADEVAELVERRHYPAEPPGLASLPAVAVDFASYPGLDTAVAILTGIGILVGLAFLIAPVTTLFAGIFADEVAELVERRHYPADPPGRAVPLHQAVAMSLKFFGVVVLVNLAVLVLIFLPGINVAAFFLANGYLLGREYFEAAAARFMPVAEARALRQAHAGRVFAAGLVIAVFLAVPLLNLLTPLFATSFMVHVHKRVTGR